MPPEKGHGGVGSRKEALGFQVRIMRTGKVFSHVLAAVFGGSVSRVQPPRYQGRVAKHRTRLGGREKKVVLPSLS